MQKSLPAIPSFSREEIGVEFALWLRDELAARPAETAGILARIVGVTKETIANYASGASPGFAKSLTIFASLDGWRDFWNRLIGPAQSLAQQYRDALSVMNVAHPKIAEHPSTPECDEAIDVLLEVVRVGLDHIEALRLLQKVRARNGGR